MYELPLKRAEEILGRIPGRIGGGKIVDISAGVAECISEEISEGVAGRTLEGFPSGFWEIIPKSRAGSDWVSKNKNFRHHISGKRDKGIILTVIWWKIFQAFLEKSE